ncbi:MAG: hypothetical protein K9J37_23455 [Saprospiraceae bacterium]|nr:hypothetical protein [Saprospiraceae bacterium]MCF8252883.1 hypothetical protein [Saprospiraceae bacterium]MCF8314429.1 hypothetical protein [Saprospiraceae bacterium]MCF8443319.1 hypothetical protein [Saprospiraceae bacterium]
MLVDIVAESDIFAGRQTAFAKCPFLLAKAEIAVKVETLFLGAIELLALQLDDSCHQTLALKS